MKLKTKSKQTEIGEIPEDWEVKELQKISKVIDSCHKTPEYSLEGISMVRVTDIKYGDLDLKNTLKVTKEIYDEFTLNHKPTKNDIVMSRVGTYGITSFANTNQLFCLGQNTVLIHPLTSSRFIYYALNSKYVKKQIEEEVVGSTQKTISLKDIRELLITHPNNPKELDKIAKILSDLDSKIEINQQMNKVLESIGQAIFKRWFINFEFPNEKGNPYKSSGGEMVDSELGKIPKGWIVLRLNDKFDFLKGIEPGSKYYNKEKRGKRFFRVGNLTGKRDEELYVDIKTKSYCFRNEVIVSFDGTVGIVKIGFEGVYSSGIKKVISKNKLYPDSFIYFLMKSDNIQQQIQSFTGDETTIKHVGKYIDNLKFAFPYKNEEKVLKNFNQITSLILDKILKNLDEIQNLSQIRDSLLPKLMSGKIRVPIEVRK